MRTPDQKSVTIGSKSMEAMWKEIAKGSKEEEPPEGSLCAREYSQRFGVPLVEARNFLVRREHSGHLVATSVRRRIGGKLHAVTYYTPKAAK